jgi:hypothetical protein
MTSLMVTFRTFSFLDFLAALLQKSISLASNSFVFCVFSVHNSYIYVFNFFCRNLHASLKCLSVR